MRKPRWQNAVSSKCKNNPWRTQNIARNKTESGKRRTNEHQGSSRASEKAGGSFSERRVRMFCQFAAENALRDELNQNVKNSR